MDFPLTTITSIAGLAVALIAWSAFIFRAGRRSILTTVVATGLFGAWLAMSAWLAHHNVFLGPESPPMLIGVPIGAALVVGVLALAHRGFRDFVYQVPAPLWVAPHVLRLLGLDFVVLAELGYLPMEFAAPAGYGDTLTAVLAVPVLVLMIAQPRAARVALVVWNVVGILDFVGAFVAGPTQIPSFLAANPAPYAMNFFVLIPIFVVPIYLLTHVYSLFQLVPRDGGPVASPFSVNKAL